MTKDYSYSELLDLQLKYKSDHDVLDLIDTVEALQEDWIDIDKLKDKINSLDSEVENLQDELNDAEYQIKDLEKQLKEKEAA